MRAVKHPQHALARALRPHPSLLLSSPGLSVMVGDVHKLAPNPFPGLSAVLCGLRCGPWRDHEAKQRVLGSWRREELECEYTSSACHITPHVLPPIAIIPCPGIIKGAKGTQCTQAASVAHVPPVVVRVPGPASMINDLI